MVCTLLIIQSTDTHSVKRSQKTGQTAIPPKNREHRRIHQKLETPPKSETQKLRYSPLIVALIEHSPELGPNFASIIKPALR